jgi:hypothetical protein
MRGNALDRDAIQKLLVTLLTSYWNLSTITRGISEILRGLAFATVLGAWEGVGKHKNVSYGDRMDCA